MGLPIIAGQEESVVKQEPVIIAPQEGPQERFLSSSADIVFYGGAAGGGKTFGLLLEPIRHYKNSRFGAVIFRRESTQVRVEGGLWDESEGLYSTLGAKPNESTLMWKFPSGAKVKFAHLEHEKDRLKYQGAQIPFIGFDQLEHFTWKQFSYVALSRGRSTSGVAGYIRATINPDPDHWVRGFIDWWIGQDGYAIPERSGIIRWFIVQGDRVIWGGTHDGLILEHGCKHQLNSNVKNDKGMCSVCKAEWILPKSFTFIASSIYDNPILLSKDPGYLANLKAMSLVDRERLEKGNWDIREAAGNFFRREWLPLIDAAPAGLDIIRYWDLAATEDQEEGSTKPAYTAGVKVGRSVDGYTYILDVQRFRSTAGAVLRNIKAIATQDGTGVAVGVEQDPGQAGKAQIELYAKELAHYRFRKAAPRESKGARAKPFSAQAEVGNVRLVRGAWNEEYINELVNFDGINGFKDQVDASSGAYYLLTRKSRAGAWGSRGGGGN